MYSYKKSFLLKIIKILLLNVILLFTITSCNKVEENKKITSTVSILEEKVDKLEKKVDKIEKIGENTIEVEKNIIGKKLSGEKNNSFCNKFIESGKYYNIWSDTEPQINKTHIFCGEYNKRGKPTGFHAKIFGINPDTIISFKIKDKKDKNGVYTANIELKNLDGGKNKSKFSSIFPDNLTMKEVEDAIIHSFKNNYKYNKKSGYFKGPSGLGFDISGYIYKNTGKINTAFPIYTK